MRLFGFEIRRAPKGAAWIDALRDTSPGGLWQVNKQLAHLTNILERNIMRTLADLKAALDRLAATTEAEKAEVTTALNNLKDKITALQTQIGNGVAVSQEDLAAFIAEVDGINTKVADITIPDIPLPQPTGDTGGEKAPGSGEPVPGSTEPVPGTAADPAAKAADPGTNG